MQALLTFNCIHAIAEAISYLNNVTSTLQVVVVARECRLSFLFMFLLLIVAATVQAKFLPLRRT